MTDTDTGVHDGQHRSCPACFSIKLRTIQLQGPSAGEREQTVHSRDLDMAAYGEMRRQGVQPKNVYGSHEIAQKAESTFEVENGVIMAPGIRKEMETRMANAKEMLSK